MITGCPHCCTPVQPFASSTQEEGGSSTSPPLFPWEAAPAPLLAAPLTCQASVDLVVVGPEPEDSLLPARHLVHGLSCHGLEVLGTLLAAEEVLDVAAHGAQHLQR